MNSKQDLIQKSIERAIAKGELHPQILADQKAKDFPIENQPDRQPTEESSLRLGDMRILPDVLDRPNESRTYQTTGAAQAFMRPDPFIAGVKSPLNSVPPNYDVLEDVRPDVPTTMNFRERTTTAPIGEPGTYRPTQPGKIGGVQKRGFTRGMWRDVVQQGNDVNGNGR